VRYFGFDGWQIYGCLSYNYDDRRSFRGEVVSRSEGRFVARTTCDTPAGELWSETTYYEADPPTATRKWIKNLKEDMPKVRYMIPEIVGYDDAPLREQMEYCGDSAAVGICVGIPGIGLYPI